MWLDVESGGDWDIESAAGRVQSGVELAAGWGVEWAADWDIELAAD